jgi:hypothetical protein
MEVGIEGGFFVKSYLCVLLLGMFGFVSVSSRGQSDSPNNGYVPDEATAVRIAEAVFIPIYGQKHVYSERPFHARLQGEYWIVKGSLSKPRKPDEIIVGGTMMAEINRTTGCIKAVYHLK